MKRSVVVSSIHMFCCLAGGAYASAAETAQYGSVEASAPEFNVMGFGDISYVSRDDTSPDGFAIGQLVAHLSASLGDSLSIFGEFSATGKDAEYSFEVERLIVKYEFSDTYRLSAGRFHTPIGYWNSAFHHGAWLQTSATRPEMVKFGSKLVPIHFVGISLEGALPATELGLAYKVGFGNGRHGNIARAGDAGDINGDKAWLVEISAKPHKVFGLNAGLGFYSDEVSLASGQTVRENSVSGYVAYSKESPEFILEYLHSEHELASDSSVSGDVDAWYAQLAYRLPGEKHLWKPYLRLEHTDVDDSDPLLGAEALDYDGGVLGLRWDFNHYAALKMEYRNEEFDNGGRENNFRLQLSFALAKL